MQMIQYSIQKTLKTPHKTIRINEFSKITGHSSIYRNLLHFFTLTMKYQKGNVHNPFYFLCSKIFTYLLDCARSQLQHARSLVVVCKLLVVACGIQFPDQGSNPSRQHQEFRVLATEPPWKYQQSLLKFYQKNKTLRNKPYQGVKDLIC